MFAEELAIIYSTNNNCRKVCFFYILIKKSASKKINVNWKICLSGC